MSDTYETCIEGIRILPGLWRPHFPWEHIAWISPPWAGHDYLWLDFPEAIFTDHGLMYLSHVNPPFRTVFSDLPPVAWQAVDGGIAFERTLPNAVAFGGSLRVQRSSRVAMELWIRNGLSEPLGSIKLQTCAFLRAIAEFGEFTQDNKFVHSGGQWVTLSEAAQRSGGGPYSVGWGGSGPYVADWPVLVTVSNRAQRLVAMTWGGHTMDMVGNPQHPCMHADPFFPDLAPGETKTLHGEIVFFEGPVEDFRLSNVE